MRVLPILSAACVSAALVLASACKKPEPAIVDAGAPEPAATDAAPAVLTPLDVDSGFDAGVDAAPAVHHGGTGRNTNQLRVKQCCNDLRKTVGTDPMFAALLTQCDAIAAQVGAGGGKAPELAPLLQMLKGKTIPPVCQGL
jgi:hypothetical protein